MADRNRIVSAGMLAVVCAGTAYLIATGPMGMRTWAALLIAAGGAATAIAWRLWPRVAAVAAVVTAWVVFVPFVTFAFSATTLGLGLDYQGRIGALLLYGVVIGLLAIQYSAGRAWLTTALALLAVLLVAMFAYWVGWSWGLWPGYAAGLAILWLRCGGVAWIYDTWDALGEWVDERRGRRSPDLASWPTHTSAEAITASSLTRLPEGYAVLHDRLIPGSRDDAETIDHIVIGPRGVVVVGSLNCAGGKVTVRKNGTVWLSGDRLDQSFRHVAWQSAVVAHMSALPTSTIVVLQNALVAFSEPIRVSLVEHYDNENEDVIGEVAVVDGRASSGAVLLDLIESGSTDREYAPSQIRRYRRRIARALPARRFARPSSADVRAQVAGLYPSEVDPVVSSPRAVEQGEDVPAAASEPVVDEASSNSTAGPSSELEHREYELGTSPELDAAAAAAHEEIAASDLQVGDKVSSMREDGFLVDWYVVSDPYVHADHAVAVADIAERRDWEAAEQRGMPVARYLAEPLRNLMRAENAE